MRLLNSAEPPPRLLLFSGPGGLALQSCAPQLARLPFKHLPSLCVAACTLSGTGIAVPGATVAGRMVGTAQVRHLAIGHHTLTDPWATPHPREPLRYVTSLWATPH